MGYGIAFPLAGLPLGAHRPLVDGLVDAGYTDLWCGESNGTDAFAALALASAWTDRLRLGTAIVSAFSRGPATLAMAAATLADLAPGRFVLGVGASSPQLVTDWNALPYERPLARVSDLLDFLSDALAGRLVDDDYATFAVRRFRLERPPASPPRLAVAALRPRMLELAGARADAAILAWLAPHDVARVLPHLAVAGRSPEVISFVFACPTTDPAATRHGLRPHVARYLNAPGYAGLQRWLGRGEELADTWRAWAVGDRVGSAAAVPETVIDDLFLIGDVEEIRAGIAAYVRAGVDTPLLHLLPGPGFSAGSAALALAP
jgi:probable F420-dependent oxidoreductase